MVLPDTLRYIGAEAFNGCYNAFKKIVIPESIKCIGSHAFRGCLLLEKAVFPSSIENIGSGIFDGCEKLSEILVPKGCAKKYKEQLPFYADKIIEMEEDINEE